MGVVLFDIVAVVVVVDSRNLTLKCGQNRVSNNGNNILVVTLKICFISRLLCTRAFNFLLLPPEYIMGKDNKK